MDNIIKELHLLLIYLTGWEEESRIEPGCSLFKSWRGYLYEVLDELEASELIIQHGSTRLLVMTDEGKREAQQLKGKYIHK